MDKTKQMFPELNEFKYDFDAKTTKPVKEFLLSKKGICYDFVNYIYHKNNNVKCYFIYTNKGNNTHTFALLNDIWIEYAWKTYKGEHANFNYNKIVDLFCKEYNCDKSSILLVEYKPNNKVQTIKEFCDDRFKQTNDISLESYSGYASSKKKKYSKNNKREVIGRRRFKCEDCGQRFGTFDQLFKHATKMHSDLINNEDPYKYLFDKRNPGIKLCVICKKNTCEWNPVKHKYARYCTNPECKKKAREMFQKNMKRIYGTDNLLNDPEHQAEMLANRKISGRYTWKDGVQIIYVGKYELDFLQYCENTLHFTSSDVVPFPTNKAIKYLDKFTNVERFYIPDFWIPSLNLAIEIKDGSKYPLDSKAKMAMKEEAVIKLDKFNFIKIVDKDYSDFNDLIKTLKDLNCAEVKKDGNHIFIIPAPSNNSL